jgi:hypothetical protein
VHLTYIHDEYQKANLITLLQQDHNRNRSGSKTFVGPANRSLPHGYKDRVFFTDIRRAKVSRILGKFRISSEARFVKVAATKGRLSCFSAY